MHGIVRRDSLKRVGAADAADLTGLSGCIGGGGGGGGPERLVVIGYPESGIQLFRDYYSASDGSEETFVLDEIHSGLTSGQVGNDMTNMTGTTSAVGDPNQNTLNRLSEDKYDAAPGAFMSQTYDSVAIRLLPNVIAGENSDPAIKDRMRRMANPDGVTAGPNNFVEGIEAAANGEDIDYQDAFSSANFGENGDPVEAVYFVQEFNAESGATSSVETQSFAGENSDGDDPSTDSGPRGSDREMPAGILLPGTDDLTAVGAPTIQTAQILVMQVNDANPTGLSVNAQIEDIQTSSSSGVSATQPLVFMGALSVYGSASPGVSVPISKQAFIPNEIVGCSPPSTALFVSDLEDNNFIFQTAPSDFLQGRVMTQVMTECLEASSASTLYVNNDYGQQLLERFSNVFSGSLDGKMHNQVTFSIGESSYSSIIETTLPDPDS